MTWLRFEAAAFCFALQFLTRLPIPKTVTYTPERFAAAPRYYPAVGAVIGGFCAIVYVLCAELLPPAVPVLLSTGAGIMLTGAFHEDGLADTFDGIGGGLTREAALDIMKDSRIGTYGMLALAMTVATKCMCLIFLYGFGLLACLVGAHAVSRFSSIVVLATSTYQRSDGTAKPVSDGISIPSLLCGGVFAGAACLPLALHLTPQAVLAALAGTVFGHVGMRLFFERKIGGYTGDTLGAVQQISELGFYLGLLTWLS